MKTIKGETYGAVDDDEYVDYGLIGNKIHYYAYRQRHSPKVKKSYDTAHSAYLALLRGTFFTHRNLRNLFYICECPRCDKFHLIPRKVVRENREIGQYIVHNVDK